MADVVFSDQNFEQDVLKNKEPVLVDFWAPWCGPCKIVSPIVKELAKEYSGKVKIGELNVDDNPDSAARYGVMSIPTLMIFKAGQPVKTIIGAQSKEAIKQGIEETIAS